MSTGIPTTIVLTGVTMLAATTLDPTLIAAAIVTVIAAIGGMVVQIINARSAARDRRDTAERERLAATERKALFEQAQYAAKIAEENNKKADTLVTSTAKIEELTNSTNSNLQKGLEVMTVKHNALELKIVHMEKEKAETAAVRALTDQQAAQALQSNPPKNDEPSEVKIVNEPTEPVPTVPIKIAKEPKTP